VLVCRRVHRGGNEGGHEGDAVLAAFNLGEQPAVHDLGRAPRPAGDRLALHGAVLDSARLHLPPGSALVLPIDPTPDRAP
jgi:hypothetical protein